MSKHRPPSGSPGSAPQIPPRTGAVTADSPVDAIRAERAQVFDELMRRQEYKLLLALRARLDSLPPVPEPFASPANEG